VLYLSHGENSVADIFKLLEAKTDVEFIYKHIRLGVMVLGGIGTQVPGPVDGIC
jgi:hypothetical protein